MSLTHLIKSTLENLTGYYIQKRNDLPVGVSLKCDIIYKLKKIKLLTVFDVGANIGQTALQFSKDFPEAKIHSFEPILNTYKTLSENTSKLPNVVCHHLAFGDEPGEIEISVFDEANSELNSLVQSNMNLNANSKKEIIKVDTIDNFINVNNIKTIDLLKIDTEGFEINVLNSAKNAFKNNQIKLILLEVGLDNEFNKRHLNIIEIQEYLTKMNFTFVGYYNIAHSLIPTKHHFANALYVNASYI